MAEAPGMYMIKDEHITLCVMSVVHPHCCCCKPHWMWFLTQQPCGRLDMRLRCSNAGSPHAVEWSFRLFAALCWLQYCTELPVSLLLHARPDAFGAGLQNEVIPMIESSSYIISYIIISA